MKLSQPALQISKYAGMVQALRAHTSGLANSFWVCGSRATGTSTPQSDLDICFLLKPGTTEPQFKTHLREVLDYNDEYPEYFTSGKTEIWWCEDGEVSVKLFTTQEIRELMALYDTGDVDEFLKHQALIQHKFLSSDIQFDTDDFVRNHSTFFSRSNHRIFRMIALEFLIRLRNKLTWWSHRKQWKNEFEHLIDLAVVVDEIAQSHYALNYRLKMEGLKEYHNDLPTLSPYIKPEVEAIINIDRRDYTGQIKKKLIGTIYSKLSDFYDQNGLGL